ncbi:MAG: DNA mismatch repair protein MutS [Flavisolibacter sp.]
MKLYPPAAPIQLEFDKVKAFLSDKCKTEYAKTKTVNLRIHTRIEFIEKELKQAYEFKQLLQNAIYFPNDYILNLNRELTLLGIEGALLSGEELISVKKLSSSIESLFRWFDEERKIAFSALAELIMATHCEKKIIVLIDVVIDESGLVKDNASDDLASIRTSLFRKRNELRKAFDRIVARLSKQGYLADIEESFMGGRRVVAVFAEQKRMVKGVLHGQSDSRRTVFIEPEETLGLNNELILLENEEKKEIYKILKELTKKLAVFAPLLWQYHAILGEYDFIRAKALLAIDFHGEYPQVLDKAIVHLKMAFHPLLFLYNNRLKKPTMTVDVTLEEKNRILVISGPNAGGKTVTLKTVGLLQMMVQSGLLVPVHPSSIFGIFKQIMIHIGDTQSIEFELSTYSSHLLGMKYFMENASGKTLFFIDDLGSGSDPHVGGAFAEVILEELSCKHSLGIVTTHYLNLKVMANKTPGIINGAMAFDEKNLVPLYKLIIGKPGSSYTFSIAERIGLERRLIEKAKTLVDEEHFRLDKLLNRAEQDLQKVLEKQKDLQELVKENRKLKVEMESVLNRQRHLQQVEILSLQNKISEDRISYLKDMERKLKQLIIEWRKTEDKSKVIKARASLLLKKNEQQAVSKKQKMLDATYVEVKGEIKVGDKVKMKTNLQVGDVLDIRGKKAVVKIGYLPMQINLDELALIIDKTTK